MIRAPALSWSYTLFGSGASLGRSPLRRRASTRWFSQPALAMHAAVIRERVCRQAAWLGVTVDAAANASGAARISEASGWVAIWVIPTDEELKIARHTKALIDAGVR